MIDNCNPDDSRYETQKDSVHDPGILKSSCVWTKKSSSERSAFKNNVSLLALPLKYLLSVFAEVGVTGAKLAKFQMLYSHDLSLGLQPYNIHTTHVNNLYRASHSSTRTGMTGSRISFTARPFSCIRLHRTVHSRHC